MNACCCLPLSYLLLHSKNKYVYTNIFAPKIITDSNGCCCCRMFSVWSMAFEVVSLSLNNTNAHVKTP